MAADVNLILDSGQTITGDTNGTPVTCEGGWLGWAKLKLGAMTGGTSLAVRIQFSIDEGANYYMAGKFQLLGGNDDNKYLAIPVYIPQPDTAGELVRVRVNYDDTGAGTWVITKCWLEPMLSLAVPALDEELQEGAAALVAAT